MLDDRDLDDSLARILVAGPRVEAHALVEWAILALEQGRDGRSLRMLAGCNPTLEPDECEELFRRARSELGIGEAERQRVVRQLVRRLRSNALTGSAPLRASLRDLVELRHLAPDLTVELQSLVALDVRLWALECVAIEPVELWLEASLAEVHRGISDDDEPQDDPELRALLAAHRVPDIWVGSIVRALGARFRELDAEIRAALAATAE